MTMFCGIFTQKQINRKLRRAHSKQVHTNETASNVSPSLVTVISAVSNEELQNSCVPRSSTSLHHAARKTQLTSRRVVNAHTNQWDEEVYVFRTNIFTVLVFSTKN